MALRICIVSPDVMGPIRNGGVGTACAALAQELALAGHEVTLCYALGLYENDDEDAWRAFYHRYGVDFIALPASSTPPAQAAPTVYEWDAIEVSYRVYEYLKTQSFDVVHFPVHVGLGYFAAVARRQGIALANTRIWVTCHAPSLWSRRGNLAACDDIAFHVRDRLERGSVEHCDHLISPSRYMLDWLRAQGWSLPARTSVIPNLLPHNGAAAKAADPGPLPATWKGTPKELVFFGRLEPRKGLQIFCDAIERLVGTVPNTLQITFLGKRSHELGEGWLGQRVKAWPFGWKIIDDFDTFQATAYLRAAGRMAIMPSLRDNAPCSVLEALSLGIPFLATDVGGVAELVMEEDRTKVLCQPNPVALAAAIARVLQDGAVTARPARARHDVRQAHRDMHAACLNGDAAPVRPAAPATARSTPLVSACLLHLERGVELTRAVESIFRQTYEAVEVIVVDNGSRCPVALDHLDRLERRYGQDRLRIIRLPENVYEPRGRNTAAQAARGEFLLFMDDDNAAKPHELASFVTAARHTDADIYTCFADHFDTEDVPETESEASQRFLVIGDAGPVGLIFNAFGDVNFLARRDRFLGIGGFIEDQCFNHAEDWRFLAHAYARGLKISVVPEALFWYRSHAAPEGASWRKRDIPGALYRVADSATPGGAPDNTLVHLAQGLFWRAADAHRELEWLRQELCDRGDELARAHARIAQQQRLNDHARETLHVLHEALRQAVEASGPEPRIDAIWKAAQCHYLPYAQGPHALENGSSSGQPGERRPGEGRRRSHLMKNMRQLLRAGLSLARPRG